jgi:hypothetical protein
VRAVVAKQEMSLPESAPALNDMKMMCSGPTSPEVLAPGNPELAPILVAKLGDGDDLVKAEHVEAVVERCATGLRRVLPSHLATAGSASTA